MIDFKPIRIVSIDNAIKEYIDYCSSIGTLSNTSVYNRSLELNRFNRFCISRNVQNVHEIQKNVVISYLGAQKVSNRTKNNIMNVISAFLGYLVTEGLLLDNYLNSVKKPKTHEIEGDFLTKDEINHLFYVMANNSPEKQIDRNLLLLSMFTVLCMRVTETVNLKISDVHLTERNILITRKGGKIAKLPLNDDLVDKFNNWYNIRSSFAGNTLPWVFLTTHGKQMTVREARHIVASALKKAGFAKRKNGPHLLRHSGATLYLQQGEDIKTIQYLLGHSNLTTTSKYVHSNSFILENSINNCPKFGIIPNKDQ